MFYRGPICRVSSLVNWAMFPEVLRINAVLMVQNIMKHLCQAPKENQNVSSLENWNVAFISTIETCLTFDN